MIILEAFTVAPRRSSAPISVESLNSSGLVSMETSCPI